MPFFQATPSISIYYIDESPFSCHSPPKYTALLIPGITCDLHDWNWQVPFLLEKGFRVITPDPRGQGRSSAPLPSENITSYPGPDASPEQIDYYPQSTASDLLALLTSLDITSNVLIISHSLGTCAALQLAVHHPSLVCGVVLIDPLHCMPSSLCDQLFPSPEQATSAMRDMLGSGGEMYPSTVPGWHRAWITRRGMAQDPKITAAMVSAVWTDKDGLGRKEVSVEKHGGRKIKCPRLTVGNSEMWVATDAEEGMQGDKDEVVVITGVGHWLHQLKSEEFNDVLGKWLEKVGLVNEVAASTAGSQREVHGGEER
ncbi:Non-heme chloroperoxidase [Podospora australis]|uniref:Non-heme chloroperoxidase n=1 Tax=Podospora australis TaxID=1536484 RepID=A0AAN7ADV4_9PEZI|nr:Non-heme chloroperoxidase [Podospora australis]